MCTGAEAVLLAKTGAIGVSAIQARKLAKFQSAQASANAQAEEDAGELRAEKFRQRAKRVASSARAALAASGVGIDSITANLINKDIIERGELDASVEVSDAKDRATALRQGADIAKLRGRQAITSGIINIGASAVALNNQPSGRWITTER
jgi:hypothetical protein